jgi:hypothetical protein
MFAAVLTFRETRLAVPIFAVTRLALEMLARVVTDRYVIFAPEFTFKIEILLDTTLRVRIFEVTTLALEMLARVVTESWVIFAPADTLRV